MAILSVRVLVVDDFEPFRRSVASLFQRQPELEIIGEAADGLEAVQKAATLQPDLVLLDIGLPKLNGIQAAGRIHELSPKSKILFVSQESSPELVKAALAAGASGYVVKTDAGSELLSAVNAVVRGEVFVGHRFASLDFDGPATRKGSGSKGDPEAPSSLSQEKAGFPHRHEVCFYSDEQRFLDELTRFIGAALKADSAIIVVATESHREALLPRLQAHGVDIAAAIEHGSYISLDAAETLSTFMVNGLPDPARFFKVTGDLILEASKAGPGRNARVAACGACAPVLWAQGNADGALRLEHLWDAVAKIYDVDVLCGYALGSFQGGVGSYIFEKLCAVHSAVYSR